MPVTTPWRRKGIFFSFFIKEKKQEQREYIVSSKLQLEFLCKEESNILTDTIYLVKKNKLSNSL